MNRVHRVLTNISYSFFAQVWLICLSFATLPYIIWKLGTTAYGVYGMILTVLGYFALLDMGMGSAVVKYISEFWAKQDHSTAGRVFQTALFFYCGLGLLGAGAVALLAGVIVRRVLNIPIGFIETSQAAFLIAALGLLLNMPTLALSSVPVGLQRIDLHAKMRIVFQTLSTLAIVAVLAAGYGLRAVVLVQVAMSLSTFAAYKVLARRLSPIFAFRPRLDRSASRILFRFSTFKFVGMVSGQLIFHLDKLIIGIFLPIEMLPFYLVPLGIAQKLGLVLVNNVSESLFPALSGSFATDSLDSIKDTYLRAERLIFVILLPIGIFFAVYGRTFLGLWLGSEFADHAYPALRILIAGYVVAGMGSIPSLTSEAAGRPEHPALFGALSAIMNVGLCLVLVPRFKLVGAAVSVSFPMVFGFILYIRFLHRRYLHISAGQFVKSCMLKPLLAAAVVFSLLYPVVGRFGSGKPEGASPVSFILLMGLFGIATLAYTGASLALGTFDSKDIERFYSFTGLRRGKRP